MHIVVAIDFADTTEQLLQVAQKTAKASGAAVLLRHVAEPDPSFAGFAAGSNAVRDQIAHKFREQHRDLQAHADALRRAGVETTALLVQGATAESILAEAERVDADCIVMGTHGVVQ